MKAKCLMLVCLLVAGLMAVGCAPAKAPKAGVPPGYEKIRMVGSSLGGKASTVVMVFATMFNKYYPDIEWSSSSGATSTNVVYITKGTLKVGMGNPA